MREECGWESPGEEEDITAIGMLQRTRSAGSASDKSDDSEFHRLAVRTIDAYSAALRSWTEEFKRNVCKSHRQVKDKSLWTLLLAKK